MLLINAKVGSNQVSRIYLGSNLIWDHPDIPLEYIANGPDSDSSAKNVWFDTGVPIVNTSNLKVEIKTAAYRNNQAWPIGGINNASWAGFCVYAPYQGGGFGMYSIRINNRSVGVGNTNFTSNQAHVITAYLDTSDVNPSNSSQYRPVMIFDGTEYRSTEYGAIPNQGMNLFLFTRNPQAGQTISGSPSGLKIYYVKIWDNGTLIRHYKPVLHMSGYQYIPCFKDQVSGDYNYNLGTDAPVYSI